MVAVLDKIVAATRARVAGAKRSADFDQLERLAERHQPRGLRRALQHARFSQQEPETGRPIAVIAELKKASPSKGLIRADFHPAELARELEAAGATALSVLTDEEFFQGSLRNLREASASVSIPCLRKDFIVDEMQVLEARANKADAILLIVAALSQAELEMLARRAGEYRLDVLCEVHEREEVQRAIDAGCNLIGVNNRDLQTFQVDLRTALRLADLIPPEAVRVAESGIHSGVEIAQLRGAGYQAFLIGEHLMRAADPAEAVRALVAP